MLTTILVSIVLIDGSLTSVAAAGPKQRDGIVHGTVMVAPTCPGPELLDRRNCLPRPQQATVRVLQGESDRPVTAITTDRSGRFRLTLPPGTYRFVPMMPGAVSIGKPREVRVAAGSSISIQLTIDTGMR
jgi:hypothetical protein